MALYDVKYCCGHTFSTKIYGRADNRKRRIEYLSNYCYCPQCEEKERQQERESEIDAAWEHAVSEGLPELSGTEKQVEWALVLRYRFLQYLKKDKADPFLRWIVEEHTDANFWINNREKENYPSFLLKSLKEWQKQGQ